MFFLKKYENLLLFYILIVSVLSVYYLMGLNIVITNNAIAEWLINYQGGFVRRGFLGEFIYQISLFFKLNLRFVFLILQIFLYLTYYYLIYRILKDISFNYLIFVTIFSPLFISFPIAELEALGRKEVILFIILILSSNIFFNNKKNNLGLFFISLSFPILLLIFETSIFYSLFFIFIILISCKELNKKYFIKLFYLSLPTLIVILIIVLNPHSIQDTERMCDSLKKIGESCGMPTFFLSKEIGFHMSEVSWKFEHILRYLTIFILGFGPLLILIKNSYFNKAKVNKNFKQISLIYYFLVPVFTSFIMMVIAVDSGRWMHISYTCSIITYYVMLKNQVIILNQNNSLIKFFNKKINNVIKIIIFLIVCMSWNPKAVYHEDLGSLPLYRAIEKSSNYYDNILLIKITQK